MLRLSGFCAVVLITQLLGVGSAQAEPSGRVIRTGSGYVAGTIAAGGVESFKGIPYAAPPVGDLRWRAPRPVASWKGIRDASKYAPACIQKAPGGLDVVAGEGLKESEDCLYLNVWTPAKDSGAKLPVMVWIHGGGYNFGSASEPLYDGAHLASKGVVVVSIAYRLNVFGFLALPALSREAPYHSSGNYGILDQIAALKWVRANIAAFGGDPGNVTIWGQSAGSDSVNVLQASPLAKGLFVRCIGESASQMASFGGLRGTQDLARAQREGVALMKKLGVSSLSALRRIPAARLAAESPMQWVVEDDGYVLPGWVYDIYAQGRQNKVPLLAGATAEDAKGWNMRWIKRDSQAEKAGYAAIWGTGPQAAQKSDADMFLWQMWSWMDVNQRTMGSDGGSYMYLFGQSPPKGANSCALRDPEPEGPIHAAELIYVFDNLQLCAVSWTQGDRRLEDLMSSYWVNFAKTGNPNGPGLPKWPAYESVHPQVLDFDNGARPIPLPHLRALRYIDAYVARCRRRRCAGPG